MCFDYKLRWNFTWKTCWSAWLPDPLPYWNKRFLHYLSNIHGSQVLTWGRKKEFGFHYMLKACQCVLLIPLALKYGFVNFMFQAMCSPISIQYRRIHNPLYQQQFVELSLVTLYTIQICINSAWSLFICRPILWDWGQDMIHTVSYKLNMLCLVYACVVFLEQLFSNFHHSAPHFEIKSRSILC